SAHTKKPLDDFVRKHLSHIVQVIHLPSRQGLIRARLAGAKAATGDVLLFLDAHSEANVNWLPPLLEPIAENYKTCVCPFIDVISYEDFEYRAQDEGARGAFDWEMLYKRLPLLPEDLKHPAEPFNWVGVSIMKRGIKALCKYLLVSISTVVATVIVFNFLRSNENHRRGTHGTLQGQGMFPIEPESLILERDSLVEAGSQIHSVKKIDWHNYDQISAESKRVGFPQNKEFKMKHKGEANMRRNMRRVAEVWMDEYAEYIYKRKPHYRSIDPGDLTQMHKKYLSSLPTVSVVVPFFNEHWSVLLRTVYSVIIRSPPSLMKQIILVDDCSTKAHTKKPLDDFVRKHLSHIVQVIHLPSRQGLIRARLAGAKAATGDVLLFLDAHSEANVNWLPPLLGEISNMRRVAEVWMDEYAEYIYKRKPHYRSIDPGDLTAQREIRTRLKCKPFKWFIETVAFDLVKKYPPVEPPDFAWGQISSQVLEKYCVDMENKDASSPPLRLQECLKPGTRKKRGEKHEQEFRFTFEKDIASKKRKMCLDVSDAGPRPPIKVFSCHGSQGNQLWRYDPVRHGTRSRKKAHLCG
ncbi:N-acetylgalactosaminyltransferase 6-like, partial [Diaphorina citri]|uniref:Polypeptide N-acetylgalactosaminyltransferase n=1 Tax=Diaphorina citri TaxID=121845 RepID=A0A3Q0IXC9_DIACI